MTTSNQLSNLDFSSNLVLNGINSPDKTPLVYDLSNGYNMLEMLMHLKGKRTTQVNGKDGLHSKPIMGTSRVIAEVLSNAASGSNLRVNFVDTSYDNFRLGNIVIDSSANQWQGKVIEKGAGYVILEPTTQVGTWNTAVHFVAGTYAFAGWHAAGDRLSNGTSSLYETPVYVTDRTGIIRESVGISRRDMFQTYATFHGDFWYSSQDQLAVSRFARHKTWRRYFSQDGLIGSSAYEGQTSLVGGIKWAIQQSDRGGVYMPLASAMTISDFDRFIASIADKQAAQKVKLTLLMGRGALNTIQNFSRISNSIQQTGKSNTFGGESVKGLDVYSYSISGIECDFILDPVLNDVNSFPAASTIAGINYGTRMQHTIIAVDLNDFEAVGGGMLPAMEDIYFGNEQTIYGYESGLVGSSNNIPSNVFTSGKMLVTNPTDGVTLHIYEDSGHSIIANRMGWLELAS